MTQPQFTISPDGMLTITPDGVVIIDRAQQSAPVRDYSKKAVKLAVHDGLCIELHGKNFSVTTQLDANEALALISTLAYLVREQSFEVSK